MNENRKERRCIFCKKMLIDEKIPFCIRCKLKGCDKAKRFVGCGLVLGTTIFATKELTDDLDKGN